MNGKSIAVGLVLAALFPFVVLAQGPDVEHIDSFDTTLSVRADSSMQVVETIGYDFADVPHHGIYRDIPLSYTTADGRAGSLTIRDISATDENNAPYHFTLSHEDDALRIKIGDADRTITGRHTYIISYDADGALAPYPDFDELYWNATGDAWTVPIYHSSATVQLPTSVDVNALKSHCYWGRSGAQNTCPIRTNGNDHGYTSVVFAGPALSPGEGFTVAVGFPKGLVTYPTWWQSLLSRHALLLVSFAILILAIIYCCAMLWHYRARGRGTIVPEYEPPQGLKPAQADVLVHGHISKRTWPATIVDLAVRGFVTITEEKRKNYLGILLIILAAIVVTIIALLIATGADMITVLIIIALMALLPTLLAIHFWNALSLSPRDYTLERTTKETPLEEYETKLLNILFEGSNVFSTSEVRKDTIRARALYVSMTALEDDLLKETASDSGAYELDPETAKKRRQWVIICASGVVFTFFGLLALFGDSAKSFFDALFSVHVDILFSVVVIGLAAIIAYYPQMRPRLKPEGAVEKEAWLGFKLYLETAERYRLQNLTPERFETFLPYAMVFGIEKKWAKAFAGLNVPPPQWYHGGAPGSAFQPVVFANTFGTSFASSFAASGAGGASGGGGGAGGGGGGGGGGGW